MTTRMELFLALLLLVMIAVLQVKAENRDTKKNDRKKGECLPLISETDKKSTTTTASPQNRKYHHFQCFRGMSTSVDTPCEDSHESCADWALQHKECTKNPQYMQTNCRRSCGTCVDGHGQMGGRTTIPQVLDLTRYGAAIRGTKEEDEALFYHRLKDIYRNSARHLQAMTTHDFLTLETCQNDHEHCLVRAALGHCRIADMKDEMHELCSFSCQQCHV